MDATANEYKTAAANDYVCATAKKYMICPSQQIQVHPSQWLQVCPYQQNTCYAPANKTNVMPQPKIYCTCYAPGMLHNHICMPQLRNRSFAPTNKYMIHPSQQTHVPDMFQSTIAVTPQQTKYMACPSQQIHVMPQLKRFMSTTCYALVTKCMLSHNQQLHECYSQRKIHR